MRYSHRLLRPASVLAVLATTSFSSASASTPSAKTRCANDIADAWLTSAKSSGVRLPTVLADLSNYTMTYRRAIVRDASTAVRVALWREQFAAVLANDPSLTAEQRTIIATISKSLPGWYADTARSRAHVKTMERAVQQAFPSDKAVRLFYQLGSDDGESVARRMVSRRMSFVPRFIPTAWVKALAARGVFGRLQVDNCTCNIGSAFSCGVGQDCKAAMGCTVVSGCGFLWMYWCDGKCPVIQMT